MLEGQKQDLGIQILGFRAQNLEKMAKNLKIFQYFLNS